MTTDELRRACVAGDADRVVELITGDHPVDEPLDPIGTTPLMAAGSRAVVEVLLDAGASLEPMRFGHDALDVVIADDSSAIEDRAERLVVARLLLERGASLGRRNEHGWGRLYRAAFAGDPAAVDALLALGAEPSDDPPPLAAACWGSGTDADATHRIIEALLAAGADPTVRDGAGWGLVHAAAMPYSHGTGFASSDGANIAALQTLIGHGLDVDDPGPGGTTALMLAASDGADHAVAALLALGADARRRNDSGKQALDLAADGEARLGALLAEARPDTVAAVRAARDRAAACAVLLRGRS